MYSTLITIALACIALAMRHISTHALYVAVFKGDVDVDVVTRYTYVECGAWGWYMVRCS